GLIDYYSPAINRGHDPRRHLLKALEYGAVPTFEFTYRSSDRINKTYYDRLFSWRAEDWVEEARDVYEVWTEALSVVREARMTDHRRIGQQVYQVSYSNGVHIWINYGEQPYQEE